MCDDGPTLSRLCDLLRDQRDQAETRVTQLETAVRTHRDTHADTSEEAPVGTHGSDEQTVMHEAVDAALAEVMDVDECCRDRFLDELGRRGHIVRPAGRDSLDHITRAAREVLAALDDQIAADVDEFKATCVRLGRATKALRRLVDGQHGRSD